MPRPLWTMLALLVAGVHAAAQSPISVTVDRTEVAVDEPFSVNVTVRAQTGQTVSPPVIPQSQDIRFNRSPFLQQSQIVNFNMQRNWSYQAWALKEGQLTIPPISVRIEGDTFESEPIEITATRTAAGTLPAPQEQGRQQGERQPGPAQPGRQPTLDDAVIIESEVDKRRVYQGECVMLTLRYLELDIPGLFVRYTEGQSIPLPSTEGFYSGKVARKDGIETRNGWRYQATEWRQPLFPTGTGEFIIGPWHWRGYVQGYTQRGSERRTKDLATEPITVMVRPLPNRPEGFTGAVGNFEVKASLLQSEVVQGVPTTLVVRVSGRGNPDAIAAPPLPDIGWAHSSEPESEFRYLDEQDYGRIEKRFEYQITPLEAGNLTIPEISFCYFEPALGNYRTEKVKPFQVHVKPSGESERLVAIGGIQESSRNEVEILGQDLVGIVSQAPDLSPRRSQTAANAAAAGFPPLAFAGFFLVMRRRRRLRENVEYARRHFARATVRKRLDALEESKDPADALYHALIGFVADKLNCPEGGMTSQDVQRLLDEQNASAEAKAGMVKTLRACERARYGGGTLSPAEVRALTDAAEAAVELLDRELGKGGRA